MYQEQDLLRIRAKDYGDYARQLLRTLYSTDELVGCILPSGHPRFTRPPLEKERFQLFHGEHSHSLFLQLLPHFLFHVQM
jgi:hypothetical protein